MQLRHRFSCRACNGRFRAASGSNLTSRYRHRFTASPRTSSCCQRFHRCEPARPVSLSKPDSYYLCSDSQNPAVGSTPHRPSPTIRLTFTASYENDFADNPVTDGDCRCCARRRHARHSCTEEEQGHFRVFIPTASDRKTAAWSRSSTVAACRFEGMVATRGPARPETTLTLGSAAVECVACRVFLRRAAAVGKRFHQHVAVRDVCSAEHPDPNVTSQGYRASNKSM